MSFYRFLKIAAGDLWFKDVVKDIIPQTFRYLGIDIFFSITAA
jgi:hypothetical protein